jgi:hypothetical protein
MKKLPLGIQNFRKVIEEDCVYIDKTQYIYNLINDVSYYFLSRPRRFGKSLLLDTIGDVFLGDKELFKGLWIYDSDYAFEPHSVIRLDMSSISNKTPDILVNSILYDLRSQIDRESHVVPDGEPGSMFKQLIIGLHEKYNRRVVVLVDEYDKPILNHITNTDVAEANRTVMRDFFGILNSLKPHLKFVMFIGLSKFTKASILSELSDLKDITMAEEFASICGVSAESLENYYSPHIESLKSLKQFETVGNMYDMTHSLYGGYSWDGKNKVINPSSLHSFIAHEKFDSYWHSSGVPYFLDALLKCKPESFLTLDAFNIKESEIDNFDIKNIELEPLLFQTGYLTVKSVEFVGDALHYALIIPNREVKNDLSMKMFVGLTENNTTQARVGLAKIEIRNALKNGDLDKVLELLRGLFASIPYQLHGKDEAYYHSIFYAVMTVLGFDMDVEVSVSRGRVDAVLELDDKVYVMEFKYEKCEPDASVDKKRALFDKALDEAMTQIVDQGYSEKYKGSGKAIYHAAFAFLGKDNIEMRHSRL